ncbi:MAG TPA: sugar phosphate isomerase/epimerase family protein [Armatimonadota bacterium]|nr:sugar phosphate isomerase/epimerase family protein [Armatimonadota bacterium]HPO72553.1 sugar phosphate isomerase/epimerase family protein [Armatimonadota bacterium]
MLQPKLGASLHTIEKNLTPEALAAVEGSRIATVEIHPILFAADAEGSMRAALKEMLARTGIRPMTIHAPFGGAYDLSSLDERTRQAGLEVVLEAVDLAVEFNAPMVVVHPSAEPIPAEEREERLTRSRQSLARVGERCAETGRQVALELLPRTCLGNTIEELFALLESLPEEQFGVCLDVNHLMDRFAELPEAVRRLGSRLITTHLSDYDGVDEKHWLPGQGVIDWGALLEAFDATGYTGPLNFECRLEAPTPAERVRSLEESFDWMVARWRER